MSPAALRDRPPTDADPGEARGRVLMWFRRDLRLDDNPAWAAATSEAAQVVPCYVLDPVLVDRAGHFRRHQLLAEVAALDRRLRNLGTGLLLRRGDPTRVVPGLVAEVGAQRVFANADVTPYAARRDAAVADALGRPLRAWWGTLVHAPGTVLTAKGTLSRVFTPFHRAWESTDLRPWPRPGDAELVTWPGDDPRDLAAAPLQPPGEDAAHERLAAWLHEVEDYPDTRDRFDIAGTSGLSVDLRFGTIGARRVLDVVGTSTEGRRAFVRQLAWRDWYAHLTHEHPTIADRTVDPRLRAIDWRDDADEFAAWKEGRTGYPVVDAAMRELAATGRMHNRLRMITASFLVKDLLVDWRRGERWFRHLLLDGDVPQNAGNWQWVAGTGPDAAPYFRVFNPVTQSRKFDPGGVHLRRWLPELARLPDRHVHAPWEAPAEVLETAGVRLGRDYPLPIVDHAEARERVIAAYSAARDQAAR